MTQNLLSSNSFCSKMPIFRWFAKSIYRAPFYIICFVYLRIFYNTITHECKGPVPYCPCHFLKNIWKFDVQLLIHKSKSSICLKFDQAAQRGVEFRVKKVAIGHTGDNLKTTQFLSAPISSFFIRLSSNFNINYLELISCMHKFFV